MTAAATPMPWSPRQRANVEAVIRLYEVESRKDLTSWSELWSDDAVVTFPFDPEADEKRIDGKAEIVSLTRQKFVDRERIDLDVDVVPLGNEDQVLARLQVALTFVAGGSLRLPLLCLFTLGDDGRVLAMEEYYNQAWVGDPGNGSS